MHARKVLVSNLDVNYAASKSSATQNTALNPADLAAGAIGVYGIHTAGSTNLNKLVLITDGGSEVAGAVPAASFVGSEVYIAIGKASGPSEVSQPIGVGLGVAGGLRLARGAKYVAPVRGEVRIGFNGTSGSLNLPTVVRGQDFTVNVINRADKVSGFRQPFQKIQLSIQARANAESAYSLLSRWVAAVNLRNDEIFIDKTSIRIRHNGTGAVFTTSATVSAVNGATSLTTSAAHGVTAGDLVSLDGDLYVSQAGTTGTTLVLDRPFQGPTGVIANANTLDITGAPTQWGISFRDGRDLLSLVVALQGDLAENTTITYQTGATPGSGGSKAQVADIEKEARGKKGSEDQIVRYMPLDQIYSEIGSPAGYDLYFLEVKNLNYQGTGDQGAVFDLKSVVIVAFPEGIADTANKNQSDFEDIMQATPLFGSSFPSISA